MIEYSYKDMPDKSNQGIRSEVEYGLGVMAAYFFITIGYPFDDFSDMVNKLSDEAKIFVYMTFRNKHPQLFKQ